MNVVVIVADTLQLEFGEWWKYKLLIPIQEATLLL